MSNVLFHFSLVGVELFSAYSMLTENPDENFVGIRGQASGSRCCTGLRCRRSRGCCSLTFHFRSGLNLDWSNNFLAVAATVVVVAAVAVAFDGCWDGSRSMCKGRTQVWALLK